MFECQIIVPRGVVYEWRYKIQIEASVGGEVGIWLLNMNAPSPTKYLKCPYQYTLFPECINTIISCRPEFNLYIMSVTSNFHYFNHVCSIDLSMSKDPTIFASCSWIARLTQTEIATQQTILRCLFYNKIKDLVEQTGKARRKDRWILQIFWLK